jgi:hypothetical protein
MKAAMRLLDLFIGSKFGGMLADIQFRIFYLPSAIQKRKDENKKCISLFIQTRPRTMDFKGDKIRSTPSFGGEVKLSVPCRRFTACKRTLQA